MVAWGAQDFRGRYPRATSAPILRSLPRQRADRIFAAASRALAERTCGSSRIS